jgi:hypothetical protein
LQVKSAQTHQSINSVEPSSNAKQVVANRPSAESAETAAVPHEALPNEMERNTDSANEVAVVPDSANSAGAGGDALGIGTDEDGLYDIKI